MGVRRGDYYLNTTSGNLFFARSVAVGAAVWSFVPRTMGQGTVAALTGTTNETARASIRIPAGVMGANGFLRVWHSWTNNNSAGTKTRRIRFGSANDLAGTVLHSVGPTTNILHNQLQEIQNVNNVAVQTTYCDSSTASPIGGFASSPASAAINTANDAYLVLSGQLSNGADSMTLLAYSVTLFRPDIT